MSKKLLTTKEVLKAQIDVCGNSVAYVAKNATGIVGDEVMWSLNQAVIALQDAFDKVGGEE